MASLTHWDFSAHFSGNDAAALILGIEPRESDDDDSRIRVVIDRMELHYNHARKRHYQEAFDLNSADFMDTEADRPLELESVEMNELRRQCYPADVDTPLADWVVSKDQSRFDNQYFSRHAIADWLVAIGLNSIYQFRFDQPSVDTEATGHEEGDISFELTSPIGMAHALKQEVFMPNEVARVEATSDDQSAVQTTEKPLTTKERKTLLTIIAALAKYGKIDIKEYGKSAEFISGLTDEIGANVSKRAIEDHLKKIPDALEIRMK